MKSIIILRKFDMNATKLKAQKIKELKIYD